MTWRAVPIKARLDLPMGQVHVVPEDDLREHDVSPRCWCRPRQDIADPPVWVHNSMDGREAYENGERQLS